MAVDKVVADAIEPEVFGEEWAIHDKSPETGKFEVQGKHFFVTYSHSRVTDAETFYGYLQRSILPRMCYIGDGQTAGARFYGARELHATGEPHYHVLMAFDKRVHWRDARAKFAVMIDVEVDGKTVQEVDTASIRVKTPKKSETLSWFLDCCHAYICKEGNDNVFGEWIESGVENKGAKQQRVLRQLMEEPYRDECVKLLQQHFTKDFIFRYPRAWLATKRNQCAEEYVPKFARGSWRIPSSLRQWVRTNVVGPVEGRPKSLLLVGPPRTGKTQWALSFGRPMTMTHGWSVDEIREDCSHAVLNDINVDQFPYWREFLGCQEEFVVTGKWFPQKKIHFGKPTIWTCNGDNDPRRVKQIREYLEEAGVTVVRITRPLFRIEN